MRVYSYRCTKCNVVLTFAAELVPESSGTNPMFPCPVCRVNEHIGLGFPETFERGTLTGETQAEKDAKDFLFRFLFERPRKGV